MKKQIATAVISAILLFALPGAGGAGRPIMGAAEWPDPNRGLSEKLLAFHKPSLFYENEYHGAMFFSEDGWKFVANLFYFKLGPQLKWGISVSVSDPKGEYRLGKAEIDPKKVEYSADSIDVKFGDNYVTGRNPDYHIHYVTDKATVDFAFKSRAPIWAVGEDGMFRMGPKNKYFIQSAWAAPWADVTGFIIVDGVKHEVRGQGYIDHGHYSFPFNRHMAAWEGFIAFNWKPINGHMWNITVFDYLANKEFGGKRIATLLVIKDDKIIHASPLYDLHPQDFRNEPTVGIEFPWRYTVKTTGGDCALQGVSEAKQTWEVLDIINELPEYIRPIVLKFLKRPVYWRGFGSFSGSLKCGGETVIFRDIPSFHDANYIK